MKNNTCGTHCFSLFNKKKGCGMSSFAGRIIMVNTLIDRTCEIWFQQFKSGDFNVKDKSAKTRNCKRYWMMTQLKQHYHQHWLTWIMQWLKKDQNGPRDMTKWFCCTTMPRLTHQNWQDTLKSLGWDILLLLL
jgi:hypothetical protein